MAKSISRRSSLHSCDGARHVRTDGLEQIKLASFDLLEQGADHGLSACKDCSDHPIHAHHCTESAISTTLTKGLVEVTVLMSKERPCTLLGAKHKPREHKRGKQVHPAGGACLWSSCRAAAAITGPGVC